MQIKCPRCQTLLEIPAFARDHSTLPIECGACAHRFTLRVNRPSLKIRRHDGEIVTQQEDEVIIITDFLDEELESIILTESDTVEGWQIDDSFGPISSFSPMPSVDEEREAAFLSVVARAQNDMRERARALGANGVISVQVDSVGSEDTTALRISGTAVRLIRE